MSNKYNKIYWEKGLEITTQTFIETDKYSTYLYNISRKLAVSGSYGIFSNDVDFNAGCQVINNVLIVKDVACTAITSEGYLIETDNNVLVEPKEINLNSCSEKYYYVVLKIDPYESEASKDMAPYAVFKSEIELVSGNSINSGIPISRIYCDEVNNYFIDEDYIVPSVLISANGKILEKVEIIQERLSEIINKIQDENLLMHILLMKLELEEYIPGGSPFQLIILLKKMVKAFSLRIKDLSSEAVKKFLLYEYDHNEIADMLNLGMESLDDILAKMNEKPPEPVSDNLPILH